MKELKIEDILSRTEELKNKKVGYISIIGRPNVGKSTFVNTLIGEKISIISSIPQTTRKKILAIYNDNDSQLIFFDTPGIHKSGKLFNEEINKGAINSLKEADLILYFIDSSRESGEEENYIKSLISEVNKPVLKVYTKIDLITNSQMGRLCEDCVKISSVSKEGFENLIVKIKEFLKEDIIYFPEDYYTKQDMGFRISEMIREKVFLNTKEELPHSIFIGIDEIDDSNKILKIVAYIYTETDSQKYIIIGKGGELIAKIGKEARLDLEKVFSKKVFLALRVKVKKNWRKDEKLIKDILN